jgi:SAM-dependent methyltransferase
VLDEAGDMAVYFNARSAPVGDGGVTCVGLARGNPADGWRVAPEPVLVDGAYAAQGSVLRAAPGQYRMYYSQDTLKGFRLATSTDGLVWHPAPGEPLLVPEQFGVRRMGLPYVVRAEHAWFMVFEGTDGGRFHIYMASSPDGVRWQPEREGKPVYVPPAGAWDSFGQANPSLYPARSATGRTGYVILYNGSGANDMTWDVGALASVHPRGTWSSCGEPFLRRGAPGTWNAWRVEGARLVRDKEKPAALLFFGLPTNDSYRDGQIRAHAVQPALLDRLSSAADEGVARNLAGEKSFNDTLAGRYFDVWDTYPIQRFTTTVECRMLDEGIAAAADVLVLGSGGGRELPPLLRKGCAITAVDISQEMLNAGMRRYPDAAITWIEADVHALPTADGAFDAAVCLGAVFNYLTDPARFLAEVRRCLRPGGRIFLSVLNAAHATERQEYAALKDGRVRRLYHHANLLALLAAAGFTPERSTGIRFLVDLLPPEWNAGAASAPPEGREILESLLVQEERLGDLMGADRAKFMFVVARA